MASEQTSTVEDDVLDTVQDGVPDDENPEWTRERFARAMTYPNLLPEIMRIIEADKRERGPQKAPKKQAISIRLSPDVLTALRATGRGWQARVDDALRAQFEK